MSKKGKTSAIWIHFDEDGPNKALCKYCKLQISIASGSLSNLRRHMSRRHPFPSINMERQAPAAVLHEEIDDIVQTSVNNDQPSTSTMQTSSDTTQTISSALKPSTSQPNITQYIQRPPPIRKQQKIDRQLLKMIAKGHHAFRIVEEPEFKNLVSLISHCPNYALPSRKSLSNNLLDSKYNEILAKLKVSTEAAFAVCITTDGWTSRANCSYLAITAHYIEGTELTSNVLACIEFNERHTAENIKCAIKDVTDDFGISHKISSILTDNAANVVAAAKLTNWRWIGCFAHSLNLAVKSSLSNVSEIITKVRNVVTYFHKSPNAWKMLAEAQKTT
ncbi:E3 SUMO-protein ligase ZBED1-like [Musca domestica]|uniref:E3 SUMO-protein ligase ZBED1-like n=1 Tax=Musca domestica TaxID=7370 RepID=A0ABM3VA34_MUSDO|nr:E3 SUMO-protein ligase ZBED1-like [Musca domestica]